MPMRDEKSCMILWHRPILGSVVRRVRLMVILISSSDHPAELYTWDDRQNLNFESTNPVGV